MNELIRVPVEMVTYLENGLPDVLAYLRDNRWKHDRPLAILIWRPDTGGWYVFDYAQFHQYARKFVAYWTSVRPVNPWIDTTEVFEAIQQEFNIHEHTKRPKIGPGETANQPTVEVEGAKPTAVWIDAAFPDITLGSKTKSFQDFRPILEKGIPPGPLPTFPNITEESQPRRTARDTGGDVTRSSLPKSEETIHRTPHLDYAPKAPLTPGLVLKVRVFLNTETAGPDELSDPAEIPAQPGDTEFKLSVWLTTSTHFEVIGNAVQTLVVTRGDDQSTDATFSVVCVRAPTEVEEVRLLATLAYKGRPCGRVTRFLPEGKTPAPNHSKPDSVGIEKKALAADLVVEIIRPADGGFSYEVKVTSQLWPEGAQCVHGRWPLGNARDWVANCFKEFAKSGLQPIDRYEFLKGAGKQLFRGAPDVFKDAYWRLASNPNLSGKFRSIMVLSDEPDVPWELMYPSDGPAGTQEDGPLGGKYIVGRWVRGGGQSPPQKIIVNQSLVIAPTYENGSQASLATAEDEASLVTKTIAGTAFSPVTLPDLRSKLPASAAKLLHFVCHGRASGTGPQCVSLDDGPLDTLRLAGMDAFDVFFKKNHPFVFLNACEVGRLQATLVGTEGFAPAFIQLGATAVIAPLWSVDDSVAHLIAQKFYQKLSESGSANPGEVLQSIRQLAYTGKTQGIDTYAAYCFYGDPLATVVLEPEKN